MKYLGLHKVLWMAIVILFTLCEIALLIIAFAVYLLWYLKLPPNLWVETHTSSRIDKLNGIVYKDKNPIETIKRRYEFKNVTL